MGELEANRQSVHRESVISVHEDVQVNAAQIQRNVRGMDNPVEGNLVDRRITQVTMPSERTLQADMENASVAVNFQFADSDRMRKKRLKEGKERLKLQDRLYAKELEDDARAYEDGRLVSIETAIKLSDKDLVKHYHEYRTRDSYLEARYSLLRNKYYTLLPADIMKKYPKQELMARLSNELQKADDQRNTDLIIFLQDLITVKIAEDNAAHPETADPGFSHYPRRITDKEAAHNAAAYSTNEKVINSQRYLTDEAKQQHKDAMRSVMAPDEEHRLWQEEDKDWMSPQQKEGLRGILAWMYRNCNKSSETKEPFVYKLTQAPPEKLMFMFFMVEHDMTNAPDTEYFYRALTTYTPDVNKFKDKMVASKWKFWKRIGSDSSDDVIDWSAMGRIWHYVMGCDFISDYVQAKAEEKRLENKLRDNPDANQQRANDLCGSLLQKGKILLNMYKAANLTANMSPELISNERLRQEVLRRIGEFNTQALELRNLLANPDLQMPQFDAAQAGKAAQSPAAAVGDGGGFIEGVKNTGAVVGEIDKILKITDGSAHSVLGFTGKVGYVTASSGLTSVMALLGMISSIASAFDLGEKMSTLTTADQFAQSLSVAGNISKSFGDMTAGVGKIVSQFTETLSGSSSWLGNTTVKTASQSFSTVAGGTQFIAGAVSIAAGLATTVAGGIQLGRAVSSRRDITRGRQKLSQVEIQDDEQLTEAQKTARKEQQHLKKLMTHVDNMAVNQEKSAGVKMVTGAIMMVGGALSMTGVAAPVGLVLSFLGSAISLGYNVLYARHLKHMTQRSAVDDALGLNEKIEEERAGDGPISQLNKSELEEYKNQLRQDFLARNGYATFKECYADISAYNARMLYNHIFANDDPYGDKGAYEDVVKALGLKIKRSTRQSEANIPTVKMIYSKLMQ